MTQRLHYLSREQVKAIAVLATCTQLTHDGFGTGLGGSLGLGGESATGSLIGETLAEQRLREAISGLTHEQLVELLALVYAGQDWSAARALEEYTASKQSLQGLCADFLIDKCIEQSPYLHEQLERALDVIE
ncbi:hypothetical protein ACFQDN_19360 [Pseudomonas asuensis]|uniref:DUF3775 domain-containing protein n=1 Tax=Pseudomonas asuensis TaxID=1825787 RepID=A0ABQ2GGC3_9PSED|nr:hypothetical protein [Pseudomonas asuensis]GGL93949.1 hypothetical protein GCM10009425_01080 [Pseudomonas asuensis]